MAAVTTSAPGGHTEEPGSLTDSLDIQWVNCRVLHGMTSERAAITDQMPEQDHSSSAIDGCVPTQVSDDRRQVGPDLQVLDPFPAAQGHEWVIGAGVNGST